MKKVCIITGGSSGIGKCTANALLKRGYTVYELSRSGITANSIHHITVDVTDDVSVKTAITAVVIKEKHIDLLINNAGFGISGAVEYTELDDAEKQFNVNFFGVVRMCKEVLPIMRRQNSGKIINIGSVAGVAPIPFQSFYSASKAALRSFSLSLANEVSPFGIDITYIQPGDIRSGFTAARKKQYNGDEIYHGRISRSVTGMEKDEQHGMPPEIAGNLIAKIATKKNLAPIYTIGLQYKTVCILIKLLPTTLANFIIKKIYAS